MCKRIHCNLSDHSHPLETEVLAVPADALQNLSGLVSLLTTRGSGRKEPDACGATDWTTRSPCNSVRTVGQPGLGYGVKLNTAGVIAPRSLIGKAVRANNHGRNIDGIDGWFELSSLETITSEPWSRRLCSGKNGTELCLRRNEASLNLVSLRSLVNSECHPVHANLHLRLSQPKRPIRLRNPAS